MNKNYQPVSKNAHAIRQLASWFEATAIPHTINMQAGKCDLTIKSAGGDDFEVSVPEKGGEVLVDTDCAIVPADVLVHKKPEVAFGAFHALTTAAGWGSPKPVDRGHIPDTRLQTSENFWDVAFRHRELHRAPNPAPDKFKKYKTVIERSSWRFLRMNPRLCERLQWSFEDVRQIAMMWCVNYFGHFEVACPTVNDNERKLTNYLKQRFAELYTFLTEQSKSQTPDAETFQTTVFGRTFEQTCYDPINLARNADRVKNASRDWREQIDPRAEVRCPRCESTKMQFVPVEHLEDDEDGDQFHCTSCDRFFDEEDIYSIGVDRRYIARHNEMGSYQRDSGRRLRAATLLSKLLDKLPHDEMVTTLTAAMNNEDIAYEARREARLRLIDHRKQCEACAATPLDLLVERPEEDEDAIVVHGLGVSE